MQAAAQPLLDAVRASPEVDTAAASPAALFDECLVRAISIRYRVPQDPSSGARRTAAMLAEYRNGFILERYFYEQLADYERSTQSLSEYYPRLLARLDAGQELQRWQAERATPAR